MRRLSRRGLMKAGLAGAAGVAGLGTAAKLAERYGLVPPDHGGFYGPGTTLTYAAQRVMMVGSMAREFPRSMISERPFANSSPPPTQLFLDHQATGFADWRLKVDGMVQRPLTLSVPELKRLPMRSQITEVACEEGWSYIAEWAGTPLVEVLDRAGMLPQARFVVYFTTDSLWWESLDMSDALHPQTLVTWGMNGGDLPIEFGGPLRMRVPRQLGYKSLKYMTQLTVTDSLKGFGLGLGSAEPEDGYSWFAGI